MEYDCGTFFLACWCAAASLPEDEKWVLPQSYFRTQSLGKLHAKVDKPGSQYQFTKVFVIKVSSVSMFADSEEQQGVLAVARVLWGTCSTFSFS